MVHLVIHKHTRFGHTDTMIPIKPLVVHRGAVTQGDQTVLSSPFAWLCSYGQSRRLIDANAILFP